MSGVESASTWWNKKNKAPIPSSARLFTWKTWLYQKYVINYSKLIFLWNILSPFFFVWMFCPVTSKGFCCKNKQTNEKTTTTKQTRIQLQLQCAFIFLSDNQSKGTMQTDQFYGRVTSWGEKKEGKCSISITHVHETYDIQRNSLKTNWLGTSKLVLNRNMSEEN